MGKYKILVVDDEPAILNLITQLLGNEEYTIETTVNGTLAWEKLSQKESAFDFVILDRMMPGINGLELLKMIKSDSRLGVLPVIMQSRANC
jgi:CheY-like chemotaxis protein